MTTGRPDAPHPLWATLLAEQRQRILRTLSRVVLQQLAEPSPTKEATHEPA
jgi:hypothetical protein